MKEWAVVEVVVAELNALIKYVESSLCVSVWPRQGEDRSNRQMQKRIDHKYYMPSCRLERWAEWTACRVRLDCPLLQSYREFHLLTR